MSPCKPALRSASIVRHSHALWPLHQLVLLGSSVRNIRSAHCNFRQDRYSGRRFRFGYARSNCNHHHRRPIGFCLVRGEVEQPTCLAFQDLDIPRPIWLSYGRFLGMLLSRPPTRRRLEGCTPRQAELSARRHLCVCISWGTA